MTFARGAVALARKARKAERRKVLGTKAAGASRVDKGPWRSEAHKALVRREPCLVCGDFAHHAHHIRECLPRTMGVRVGDEWCVPLCERDHRALHETNNVTFWTALGIDPLKWCRDFCLSQPQECAT